MDTKMNKTENPEKAFYYYLENCSIRILETGGSGILFLMTYKGDPEKNPYSSFNSENISSPTNQVILKLVLLNNNINDDNSNQHEFDYRYESKKMAQMSVNNFLKETSTQTYVSLNTIEYLENIAPAVFYEGIVTYDSDEFFDKIISKAPPRNAHSISRLKDFVQNTYYYDDERSYLGIICMEMATSNFQNLFHIFAKIYKSLSENQIMRETLITGNSEEIKRLKEEHFRNSKLFLYLNMVRLALINIAYKAGITHGDYHYANILFDPNYKGYFDGIEGKVLVIDYGFATEIDEDDRIVIVNTYNEILEQIDTISTEDLLKKLNTILELIYNTPRSDGIIMSNYKNYYGWIIGQYIGSGYITNDSLLSNDGLTNTDAEEMRTLIKAKISSNKKVQEKIDLLNQENVDNISLPLDEDELLRGMSILEISDSDSDSDSGVLQLSDVSFEDEDKQTGGENNDKLRNQINKAYESIMFGLTSQEKLDNEAKNILEGGNNHLKRRSNKSSKKRNTRKKGTNKKSNKKTKRNTQNKFRK